MKKQEAVVLSLILVFVVFLATAFGVAVLSKKTEGSIGENDGHRHDPNSNITEGDVEVGPLPESQNQPAEEPVSLANNTSQMMLLDWFNLSNVEKISIAKSESDAFNKTNRIKLHATEIVFCLEGSFIKLKDLGGDELNSVSMAVAIDLALKNYISQPHLDLTGEGEFKSGTFAIGYRCNVPITWQTIGNGYLSVSINSFETGGVSHGNVIVSNRGTRTLWMNPGIYNIEVNSDCRWKVKVGRANEGEFPRGPFPDVPEVVVDVPSLVVGGLVAEFVHLENGRCQFKMKDGRKVVRDLSSLLPAKQHEIMKYTGWGRVWDGKSDDFPLVADLVQVVENAVVLEKIDGTKIVVQMDTLYNSDRVYAESRRQLTSDSLPDSFSAKVVGVYDGDTITLLLNRSQYKVRVSGIDAPETGQAFGRKSKKHLSDMVHGKIVNGVRESTDKYGRNVCTVSIDNERVDLAMLEAGLAWHYLKYSNDEKREASQGVAKSEKLNIWSESGPVEPWEWRKWGSAKRKEWLANKDTKTAEGTSGASSNSPEIESGSNANPKVALKSHWLNTKGNVRHNKNCRWYNNTKHGRFCTDHDGRACQQCGG